jgi:hypothetical protein
MRLGRWITGIAMAMLAAAPLSGQTKIDDGSFRILVDGREVGTETFSIGQNGSGADRIVTATGRVVLNGSEIVANVQMSGAGLRPVFYDVELKGGDARRINGSVTGSRASARVVSSAGESMKEYLVTDGAVLLDDGVAHQYYFIAQRFAAGATRTPILVPRESRQMQVTITLGGEESVSTAGTSVRARKLIVDAGAGGVRNVWIDTAGRVLRVEIPSKNYVAIRTALP